MLLLLAKGAMLPRWSKQAELDIIRRLVLKVAAQSLIPSFANEAVVRLAMEVGRKRKEPDS
jgi:hypothetical protein